MQETTLVVMAAGMGSRFGGAKQVAPVTDDGKIILDFSVYDAKKAGFTKVVFIIRREMYEDFRSLVGDRIAKKMRVEYVFQESDDLPSGRAKPFGTGHAILCCKDAVKEPFVIINADDYYGSHAFLGMHEHLVSARPGEYAMTAYALGNTVSENGTVSRGVCETEDGYLTKVIEISGIAGDCTYKANGETVVLSEDTPVSMNLWGLTPDIFCILEEEYRKFLTTADLMKDEFFIPSVISNALRDGKAKVRVLKNLDKWYGITYREDLDSVKSAIKGYLDAGLYQGI